MTAHEHNDDMVTGRLDLIAEMAPLMHVTGCLPSNSEQQAHSCGASEDVAALVAFAREALALCDTGGDVMVEHDGEFTQVPAVRISAIRDTANRHLGN